MSFHVSAASVLSSLIPSNFISRSQDEALNSAVFNQKIHYSRNMPSFMIKISQAAHISFFRKNPAAGSEECLRLASLTVWRQLL